MKTLFSRLMAKEEPGESSRARSGEPRRDTSGDERAGLRLVLFMRLLAALWLVEALTQWGVILVPRDSLFETAPTLQGATVIFRAIFDPVAAVGLWLATPWGGVIWLLSAIVQIFAAIAQPGFLSLLWAAAAAALIAVYFILTWKAGHKGAWRSGLHRHS